MNLKLRELILISFAHVLLAASCLLYARHQADVSQELYEERIDGRRTEYARAGTASRKAGLGVAGAALTGISFVLSAGTLLGPAPVRLILGNVLVLMYLLIVLEACTHVLGVHLPSIGRAGMPGDFGLWVHDPSKGWFHAPSTEAETFLGGPDRGRVRINSIGLRGDEIARKNAGVTRILVFGDSYVFGVGVDEENTLTSRLENLLRQHYPEGVEVVNMGVSGYSTDQELLLWEELGKFLEPDLVVLVICDNDYVANTENFAWRRYYKPYFDVDDDGALHLRNVPVPVLSRFQRVKLFLGQESNLWNFVRSRESSNPTVQSFLNFFEVDVSRGPRRPYRATRAIVARFAESVVRETGASFLVTSTGRRGENPAMFESLSAFLEEKGIKHFDLLPVLQRAREREPNGQWDFPQDPHWNRDAHRLAAETISLFLSAGITP